MSTQPAGVASADRAQIAASQGPGQMIAEAMELTIRTDLDNAGFEDPHDHELAQIFQAIRENRLGKDEGACRESNGNHCGS